MGVGLFGKQNKKGTGEKRVLGHREQPSCEGPVVSRRAELAERLELLTQAAYVGEARRRLERVRRRRLRLRERVREREAEQEAEAARAAEREQEIDRWRVQCVQEVEEKKRVRAADARGGRDSGV